jgi:uracil-DNA glycosylase family 4
MPIATMNGSVRSGSRAFLALSSLAELERAVTNCRQCPRLVQHREQVARLKTRRFADETYWGRPVPAFGDPKARLLVVGLAPAAHGANRTGRMFTGDRSGDWLYEAMHRYGFASQPRSVAIGDGLELDSAFITAVARCAPPGNKPTRAELETCRPYLVRELELLRKLSVVLALGRIAFDGFLRAWREANRELPRPKPSFSHGGESVLSPTITLLSSYHPSQQNTFTGRLTRPMFHGVFRRARALVNASVPSDALRHPRRKR